MAKLIYSGITSLDGYIADEQGKFDWSEPDEEVHAFVNEVTRPVGTFLLGRRTYEVLSVEFKVNLLAPAVGDRLEARAQVIRAGRTLSVCRADVFALGGEDERHVAAMQATIIGRPIR